MNIGLLLKGIAMGIAEAIPGVSGGTIAFITGIYQELIETIKSFTPSNLKQLFINRPLFWTSINGRFLIWLLLGMGAGLISGILVISHLLDHYQSMLWAFFFGLVLASAVYLGQDIKWSSKNIFVMLVGAVIAFMITNLVPATGSDHPLYLFLSGCLAISALMLPGVSGSFVLLLLGLYNQIINGLKSMISDQDFSQLFPISVFALGALTGLFSFARVLSFLFKKYPNSTMAAMIGVLLGSLSKLWPWKKITSVYDKSIDSVIAMDGIYVTDPEQFKILREANLTPAQFADYGEPRTLLVLLCFLSGLVLVVLLSRLAAGAKQ